ncbi:uncharacterized protein [Rutidosis leptorrhynchoides]|uniref:uncharacterized protein isoform X2 n=1 Tax=Rutidosis leptorrhynchoides TaxID=125765 RepID=UPI003A98FD4A
MITGESQRVQKRRNITDLENETLLVVIHCVFSYFVFNDCLWSLVQIVALCLLTVPEAVISVPVELKAAYVVHTFPQRCLWALFHLNMKVK